MTALIEVENLSFSYRDREILSDVSFSVSANQMVGIIGPNGGGKSTLLKCIMGLLPLQKGRILINGLPPQKGRQHIGYMPQVQITDFDFPITALEVVLTSCLKRGLFYRPTATDKARALELLETMGASGLSEASYPTLSGGEKQRILLARAMMSDPSCLILDEPTCSIDSPSGHHFFDLLRQFKSDMAILMVSHDLSAIAKSVDVVGCLNKTLVIHEGGELSKADLDHAYCCDVDFIAHGLPHRVLGDHSHDE